MGLGEIGDDRAVEPLIKILENEWWESARGEAAEALGKIGDIRAIGPLKQALNDRYEEVRRKAAKALDRRG